MKSILFILSLLITSLSYGQVYKNDTSTYGIFENRIKVKNALGLPRKSGLTTNTNDTTAQIFITGLDSLIVYTNGGYLNISRGNGTVTGVTATDANGVAWTITNPTTAPILSIALGAITPTSIISSGGITGTSLSGTILTAAQPNITSIGTLTALTMSGNINLGNNNLLNVNSLSATSVTTPILVGNVTATGTFTALSIVKSGGLSTQFLKADGSIDASTYLTTSTAASTYLPLAGGTMSGSIAMGNNNITNVNSISATSITTPILVGNVTATGTFTALSIVKTGGTSTQFLKADGSVDPSTYLTSATGVSSITGTANQITASSATGAVTLSIPSVFITPGTLATGGAITAEGNITAQGGADRKINIDATTAGNGALLLKNNGITQGGFSVTGFYKGTSEQNIGIYSETGKNIQFSPEGITRVTVTTSNTTINNSVIGQSTLDITSTGLFRSSVTLGTIVGIGTGDLYAGTGTITKTINIPAAGINPLIAINTATDVGTALTSGSVVSGSYGQLDYTSSSSRTIGSSNVNGAGVFLAKPNISGSSTITMTQGASGIRAMSALTGIFYIPSSAATTSTITHAAGLRSYLYADNTSNLYTITNYYGLLVGSSLEFMPTNITNRFGIRQQGSSDINLLDGELQLGAGQVVSASTTNTVTNKIRIIINGTTYYLLASTSGL